ncbi:phosphatidylglycerophosphatase A [Acholeplasma morum]|uniref:phosphatidylglycerophosphatase A family protein n=1 Tax=Paracholeplasma morum TaxID=264637 RepID=UPI00195DE699|nr:phosphatidylglycerophosphatase A [Paracholeplasma morum]MBM7453748.1 phosphatidylglycerophosphatase A [Paracholeplasma morum]
MSDHLLSKKEYNRLNDTKKYDIIKERLSQRGIELIDMARLTYDLQKPYVPELTLEICLEHIDRVVLKREVQHAVLVGIELDVLAEEKKLSEPLLSMLLGDYGLFGIDEILALSIVNVYGSIGLTNFGYVDKLKPGIIGEIDNAGKEEGRCNTFLDDIVGAIASAAASSIAHKYSK